MLGAFPAGEDGRVRGPHRIVNDDATPDRKPGRCGQRRIGPDAHRQHHQPRWQHATIAETYALGANRCGLGGGDDSDIFVRQMAAQALGGGRVQLPFHQPINRVQHSDPHAARRKPSRCFQPEQAAADHHCIAAAARGRHHRFDIGHRAIQQHMRQVRTGQGQADRTGPGC